MAEANEDFVEGAEPENEERPEPEGEPNEEIPVRKKPWNNRQERAEFFKKKKEGEEVEEGDEELSLAQRKVLQRELKEALDPFAEIISKSQADSEVNSYLAANPSLKKFEGQARKWMEKHPTLTAESAFILASKGKGEQIDPAERAKAEEKAKRGSLGGGAVRKEVPGVPTTDKEMKAIVDQVKRGKTVKIGE